MYLYLFKQSVVLIIMSCIVRKITQISKVKKRRDFLEYAHVTRVR